MATKQKVPSSAQFLVERAFSEPQCRDTRGAFNPGVAQRSRAGIMLRDFERFGAFILGNGVANKGRCGRSAGSIRPDGRGAGPPGGTGGAIAALLGRAAPTGGADRPGPVREGPVQARRGLRRQG